MLNDIKKLLKHSGIYSFGNIATKMIGIILIPLYTGVIDLHLFGIYTLLEVTMQFAMGVFPFGLPNALFRWLSLKKYEEKKLSILFTTFLFTSIITVSLVIVTLYSSNDISKFFFNTDEFGKCILFISMIVGLRLLNIIGLTYLRFEEKSIFFIIISISRMIFQLSVTIYFVAFKKLGIYGIFLGQFSGEALSSVTIFPYMFSRFKYKLELFELKKMLHYGFPLIFSELSGRILNMGNRYILGYLTNMNIVGIYGLGYKFANLIDTIFINSFRTAFVPSAWKKLEHKNAKRFYSKMMTYYVFFILWVSLFISIFSKGIIHLFARDSSYWDAYKIVPIAVYAISIRGMFTIIKMGLQYTKNTKYVAYIVMSSAVINISLSFFSVSRWGMYGAAFSSLISFTYMVSLGYFFSNKFYPQKYEWRKILSVFIVSLALLFIGSNIKINQLLIQLMLKFLLLMFYPFILYFVKFYDPQELQRINGSWNKWRNPINWKSNLSNIKIK